MTAEIPWGWIGGTLVVASLLFGGLLWWWTKRRGRRVPRDVAAEVVDILKADAKDRSEAELALAVAAGEKAVAEADATAEKEVADAVSTGGLANTLNTWPRDG